ncbi:hypothetical protein JXA63_03575 [Candidatus Woesebacteria bacterium]|nr:hypothetical protein [Candidatus Woesebacteria bacterium]
MAKNILIKKFISKFHFFVPILLFFMLMSIGFVRLDPDFGYRLKNGELIFREGFAFFKMTDPYSYTMPSYKFIEHAWGVALFIYLIYSRIGLIWLSFLWSVFVFLSLFFSTKTSRTDFYKKIPFGIFSNYLCVFILTSFSYFFAIRAQVISWLFLSFFLYLYFNERLWRKVRYLIPVFFLFWVNLHGSFLVGLATFSFLIFMDFTQEINLRSLWKFKDFKAQLADKRFKFYKEMLLLLLLSFLVTLVNPYGLNIWRQVTAEVSMGELRWKVLEWIPIIFSFKTVYGLYLAISLVFVIKQKEKVGKTRFYLYFSYLVMGLLVIRHFPLYLLVSLPITIDAIGYFFEEIKKTKGASKRAMAVFRSLSIFSFLLFFLIYFINIGNGFGLSEKSSYPMNAVGYIKQNIPEGEIFSLYGWGGYLNWKLPEKRVFVSGFMPVWDRKDAPENESTNAFKEYVGMVDGSVDYKSIFEKYDIDTVLLPIQKDSQSAKSVLMKFKIIYHYLFDRNERKSFYEILGDDGWKIKYNDDSSVIFERPQ